MAAAATPTPIYAPKFPPNTPVDIIIAYLNNEGCVCEPDDPLCSTCLTVTPEYLMQNRDAPAIGAIIALPVLAFIVVMLRTYSRAFIIKQLGLDDLLAVSTFLLYVPFQVLSIILIQMGSGRHLAYIQFVLAQNDSVVNRTEVLDFAAHLLYTTALLLCRLSGVAFYLRLLERSASWRVAACRMTAVLLLLGFIPQIVLLIVHCRPVTALWPYGWQAESADYTCLAWGVVYSTNSGISLVCDCMLVSIALFIIIGLRLAPLQKALLLPILLPGVLVIGISIVRLYLVVEGQWQADQSWWYDPMLVIENAEIGCTLIALCVPGLKPLFDKFWKGGGSYYQRRYGSDRCEGSRNAFKLQGYKDKFKRGGAAAMTNAGNNKDKSPLVDEFPRDYRGGSSNSSILNHKDMAVGASVWQKSVDPYEAWIGPAIG